MKLGKNMKKLILGLLIAVFSSQVFAEAYKITIQKRIESNLYLVSSGGSKFLLKTKYCYEYTTYEDAVLFYDEYSYDNKVIFKSGNSCEVEKIYSY